MKLDNIPQFIILCLSDSSLILLFSLSFFTILRVVGFFHIAHGIVITAGAYFAFLYSSWLGAPLFFSCILAILSAGLLGCIMDIMIYRPLRHRNATPLTLLLVSLGIYVVIQNIISIIFGDETHAIRPWVVQEGINILSARITIIQIVIIFISTALTIALSIYFQKTKIGKSMRAVANSPELACISGIDSNRIILYAFGIGSAIAGLAGILIALDVDMTPTMGMQSVMLSLVAVMISGRKHCLGVALAALLLGFARQSGVWFIGSQWQDAIAFVILVVFLLVRPEGFMGKKVKSASV